MYCALKGSHKQLNNNSYFATGTAYILKQLLSYIKHFRTVLLDNFNLSRVCRVLLLNHKHDSWIIMNLIFKNIYPINLNTISHFTLVTSVATHYVCNFMYDSI